jgi:hypothetical protein
MGSAVVSNVAAAGILGDAVAMGGTLVTSTMILTKTQVDAPNPALGMGQFEECDFTGYAAVAALVFGTPFLDVDGIWKVTAPSELFTLTATTITNIVYAAVITNAAKSEFRGVINFETPISLTVAGQGFNVIPTFPFPAQLANVAKVEN